MPKNKISFFNKVKNNGFFKIYDLFLYALILIVVLVLFFTIIFNKPTSNIDKVVFEKDNVEFFCFNFADKSYYYDESWNNFIVINTFNDNELTLTVYFDNEKTKYNVVKFDFINNDVCVLDASCSLHKDCVHSNHIKVGGNAIVCLPHGFKIFAVVATIQQPIVG